MGRHARSAQNITEHNRSKGWRRSVKTAASRDAPKPTLTVGSMVLSDGHSCLGSLLAALVESCQDCLNTDENTLRKLRNYGRKLSGIIILRLQGSIQCKLRAQPGRFCATK